MQDTEREILLRVLETTENLSNQVSKIQEKINSIEQREKYFVSVILLVLTTLLIHYLIKINVIA